MSIIILMDKRKILVKLVKFVLWLILASFFAVAIYGFFLVWKINKVENKITVKSKENTSVIDTLKNISSPHIPLQGEASGRINILLLGIAGKGNPGENLSDTLMVASLNTNTRQVALLSLPRDLFVEVPNSRVQMKINSLYQYGKNTNRGDPEKTIEPLKKTIENILSLPINYWVVVNFQGFREAIDAIGGINIMNERDIFDPRYPGPNYSYETFRLKKGFYSDMNGETALKYARMRHNDPEGDFGRAKRQQQVLQSAKNKIFSTGTLLNAKALNKLLNALGENIQTDIKPTEMGSFLDLAKNSDTANITNVVLDAWNHDSLLKVSHVFYGNIRTFVLIPRAPNWSEVRDLAQNIFDIDRLKKRREQISQENASVALKNESGDSAVGARIEKLLGINFGYKNITKVSNPQKAQSSASFLCDFSQKEKPFTLDELSSKLPAKVASDEKCSSFFRPENTDILVVIGKDLAKRYNMTEDSFEEYKNSDDNLNYSELEKNGTIIQPSIYQE